MALRLRDGKCSIASVADPAPIEGLEVLPRHARRRPGGLARQRAGSLLSGLFMCSVDLEMLPHRGKRLLDAVLDVVVRREGRESFDPPLRVAVAIAQERPVLG